MGAQSRARGKGEIHIGRVVFVVRAIACSGLVAISVALGPAATAGSVARVGAADSAAPAACDGVWRPSALPSLANNDSLSGIDAVSGADVWAVGYDGGAPLALHFDGASWTQTSLPVASGILVGVLGFAADDVWAAGSADGRPLILHFDGAAWEVSLQGSSPGSLSALGGVAPDDVWAVGTTIVHWNGSSWSDVPHPDPGVDDNLTSVTAVASDDVWAVGRFNPPNVSKTLAQHWDGSDWSTVPTPNPDPGEPNHASLAAVVDDGHSVWALGTRASGHTGTTDTRPLVERWNGSRWAIFNIAFGHPGELLGAFSQGPSVTWAVGSYRRDAGSGQRRLILRWNGVAWVDEPVTGVSGGAELRAVTGAGTDRWAAGGLLSFAADSVIVHACG